jgi:hypothetical protein
MTIRPGETWGEAVPVPADLVDVASDAELAEYLSRGDGRPVRLVGGDLLATLGGPSSGDRLQRFPVDLLRIEADGHRFVAVAHVVARDRRWAAWRGPVVAVMNTDRRGRWDVAPRAHPNDGRADVVEVDASMALRARWQARRRLPTGTHVPHPAIHTGRATDRTWRFARPLGLWIDSVGRGTVRSLRVAVEPDGATIHI